MMTTFKSVHIKECWPYEYVKPVVSARNLKRRERYRKAVSVKTAKGKRLIGLSVYEMNDDICEALNNYGT